MSSITFESTSTDKYYIEYEWQKGGGFVAQVCPRINEYMCGYPIKQSRHETKELARKAYKRYVKQYAES